LQEFAALSGYKGLVTQYSCTDHKIWFKNTSYTRISFTLHLWGPFWSWSYGSWIENPNN